MDVLTEQRYAIKFSMRLKKFKMKTIALLKEAFQILVVFIVKMWTVFPELRNRCPGDPGNPDDLWTHSKGEVWNHH